MIRFSDIYDAIRYELSGLIGNDVVQIVIAFFPVILAIGLFFIFWPLWVNYVRSYNFYKLKYFFLEVKLPKEMPKSPLAMELFLNALHNTSDGSNFAQFWKGEKRPSYSLEIISNEGVIKFVIWGEDRRKAGVISALYSQFPGVEVHEIEDYTRSLSYDPKTMKIWGAEFKFTKESYYPIKTYVDYGLDKDPKEEFKIDPMTPMIEFLGNVGMNQQVWFQFIIRAHIKEQHYPGPFKKVDEFKDSAIDAIDKILMRDKKTKVAGTIDKESGFRSPPSLSDGERETVKAIERKLAKLPFDVGIRVLYIAKKEVFDKPNGIGGILSAFKHYTTENFNGIKQDGDKWSPRLAGNPWEDFRNIRANNLIEGVVDAYKRRCYFYDPYPSTPMVMNTEELATIYHFPGSVAATPTLDRIPSKKSQAPSNLPI